MTDDQQVNVLTTDLSMQLEERPIPEPGPNEVQIAVKSVGICGSDIHYYEHGRIGSFIVEQPLILGHEASGVITKVGSNVTKLAPGMRVAMEPGVPCKTCAQCRAGNYNLCPDVIFFATPPVDGTFAQYITLDQDFAHPVPDHVSFDAAALMEPLSVGIWANRKANTKPGSRVLITGAGPIGIINAMVARASGAAHITITDTNDDRLAKAKELGFTTINPTKDAIDDALDEKHAPFDILIECSGAPTAITQGIRALGPAGTAILVGMAPSSTIEVPIDAIQSKEIWLTGTFRYANTYPTAVELVASGAIDLDQLVSKVFTLEEAEQALTYSTTDPTAMKVVVHVNE
jgi:L-iditol 2-dehydrogenase